MFLASHGQQQHVHNPNTHSPQVNMQSHQVSNQSRPHSHTPPHQYQQPVQVRQQPQIQQQQQHSYLPKSQMNGESKMGAQRPPRNVFQNQVSFLHNLHCKTKFTMRAVRPKSYPPLVNTYSETSK